MDTDIEEMIARWTLPVGGPLLDRIERMIEPTLWSGVGWRALDAKLTAREPEYRAALGPEWVADAHRQFTDEIRRMQAGEWGNGRIVARKW